MIYKTFLIGFQAIAKRPVKSCLKRNYCSLVQDQVKMIEPNLDLYDETQINLMKEMCITVDENDQILEPRSKMDCHLIKNINSGLLHRAFSVLLFNREGKFLITQRSDAKITFPGYFTNACCSHPLFTDMEMESKDGMGVKRAAQRRLFIELGIEPTSIPINDMHYMTRIMYKAASDETWGEHEIDYLIVLQKDVQLKPDPNEVKSYLFLDKNELEHFLEIEMQGGNVSPWFKLIVKAFLYKYWDNLKSLRKLQDHKVIHKIC